MSLGIRSGVKKPTKKSTKIAPLGATLTEPFVPQSVSIKDLKVGQFYDVSKAGFEPKARGLVAHIYDPPNIADMFLLNSKGKRGTLYSGYPSITLSSEEQLLLQAQHKERLSTDLSYAINSKGSCGMSGSDPEIFAFRPDGTVIPAWLFLNKKPLETEGNPTPAGTLHWDGVQGEFTTVPASCHQSVAIYIRQGLSGVLSKALKYDSGARLDYRCVVDVPEDVLADAEEEHAGLGCSPSMNAYGEPPLYVPDPRQLLIRFAGCHIHQGLGKLSEEQATPIVKTMDAILGPVMVSLLQGLEDPRRRAFYGRAGEFRLPTHGLEYRVPSSAVLCSPVAYHLVFDIGRIASWMSQMGTAFLWKANEEVVKAAVNELDMKAAQSILKENKKVLDHILGVLYGSCREKAKTAIWQGIKNVLDVSDMHETWHISTPEDRQRASWRLLPYCDSYVNTQVTNSTIEV